ncbi:MAG: hypothetical protein DRI56_04835 [Chloroflexota bacterium]|nr:MAG: hypothetical protein DRI56_04835 [Chloroflexota bacterium]
MDQYLEHDKNQKQYLITLSAWLVTTVLGVLSALAIRSTVLRNYLRFFPNEAVNAAVGKGSLYMLNILLTLTLAICVIVVVIGGFEYHHRHGNDPKYWRVTAQALAIEFAILLLPLFI